MNIVKLQNELKNVPDQALIGYVQNPTGTVPSYLALSELQRRKEMREKYQQAQPEKTTVAEDLAAPPQPQGIAAMQQPAQAPVAEPGVAGLPVPDQMFSGKGMAAGGIVAFDDGGYVNPSLYGGPVQEYEPWYKSMKLFGTKYNLYGDGLLGPNPDQDTIRAFENQRSMNPFISGMPRTDLADEYARLRLKASENKATQQDFDRMNAINESMKAAENYPTGGGPDSATSIAALKQSADKAAMNKQRDLAKEKENAIKNIYAPKGGTAKESIKSLADYAKEFRDVVGEDPMQKSLMQRMERMDAAAAKQADQAPWMALAQAGFSMAGGKSPYALQNIAAGAMEGVKSYGDAKDKMAALEDKRFSLMADMAKAQRAEQLAIASKGADSRDAALAREQQDRLADKKMANDMQIHLLDNTFDLRGKEIAAASKDLPTATERATKIKPLIMEHPDYKPRLKALVDRLGDKSVEPGSPKYKEYVDGKKAIEDSIYNEIISKPGMGSTGATYNYVPGKGIMPL